MRRYWSGHLLVFIVAAVQLLPQYGYGQTQTSSSLETNAAVVMHGTLPRGSARLGSTAVDGRLYVFGGIGATVWAEEIFSAQIAPDGSLSTWQAGALLPDRRTMLSNGVHVAGDSLYVVGRGSDVLRTRLLTEGRMSAWMKTTAYAKESVANQASCLFNNRIYVLGGREGERLTTAVLVADLNAANDGPIEWRRTTELPRAMWFHLCAAYNGRLYVWGGSVGGAAELNPDVFSAAINTQDGSIGAWHKEAPMPKPIYATAGSIINGSIVTVAGRYRNGEATNEIWVAPLDNDGSVGAWREVKTDMDNRMYHAISVDTVNERLYVLGGYAGDGLTEPDRHSGVDGIVAFRLADLGIANNGTKSQNSTTAGSDSPSQTGAAATPRPTPESSPLNTPGLDEVLRKASSQKQQVLVYFYSPDVAASSRVWKDVVSQGEFAKLTENVTFAAEATGPNAPVLARYGIYKIPCFALLNPDGVLVRKSQDVSDLQALAKLLRQ